MTSPNYVDHLADRIRANTPVDLVPGDDDAPRRLFRLYALLGLAKNENVTLRDVHDAWTTWMLERGKEHESMVPFDELAPDVQGEDEPFRRAIMAAVEEQGD